MASRRRGTRDQHGLTAVELVVTVTLLALVLGVLLDIVLVGTHSTDSRALAPADAELAIARFVSSDVRVSESVTPNGSACGVTGAELVTTAKSAPTLAHADESVAYALGPEGLTRSTCAIGAVAASTSTVVSVGVTLFVATCRAPGTCGTVHIQAATTTASGTDHPFLLDITRRSK